ncbi:hypothetical protein Tco_1224178, partial [Tanacetum coccineum]
MPSLATENIILRDVGVGDIRTVLTEDVILKSMKQRKHMLIMGVILARKVAREAGGKVGLAGNGGVSGEEGIRMVAYARNLGCNDNAFSPKDAR